MSKLRAAGRMLEINRVLTRYGIDRLLVEENLLPQAVWVGRLQPWRRRETGPRGQRIRLALEALGPVWIKLGQALSTRRDLIPEDIADELAKLLDAVPPFPSAEARQLVTDALGGTLDQHFIHFDEAPLASASIAQVHAAIVPDGREVAVKIVRPGIAKRIRRDVEAMQALAEAVERHSEQGRRLRPIEVVREFESTIFDELDMIREAANGATLKRNFEHSRLMDAPEIHWPLCRPNVLVTERIRAIPVGDVAALTAAGVNFRKLAERGVQIFFTQVFRHNFFHADMHPGNIFVDATDPENPLYVSIDFGIIGSLLPADQDSLAYCFLYFLRRDYGNVARLLIEASWVPEDTRLDEFEAAIRTVCEPIFNRPLAEISFGQLLLRLFQVGRRFEMVNQPQLVLLEKTLLQIEGLGRQLYPGLNLWDTAQPFMEEWAAERLGVRNNLEQITRKLPEIPNLAWKVMQRAEQGKLEMGLRRSDLDILRAEVRRAGRRQYLATAGGALLITATLFQFSIGLGHLAPFWGTIMGGAGIALLLAGWQD